MADDANSGGTTDKTFTQAELDAIVRDRLKREREKFGDYDDLKAKAADADKNKGALEKLLDRFGALEEKLARSARNELIAEVAEKKGLTRGQAKRLQGDTLEELMADADDLVASFKGQDGKSADGAGEKAGDGKDGDGAKAGGDSGSKEQTSGDAGKDASKDGGKDGDDKGKAKSLLGSGRPTEKLTSGAVPAAGSGDKSPAELAEEILSKPF